MENNFEIPKPIVPESLLNDPNMIALLQKGVRQFNTIVMESNDKNPDENVDDTLDNLMLLDEALGNKMDEFSEYAIREETGKNGNYHINISPRVDLQEKNGKTMLDFANGPIKEVQIKISPTFEHPLNTSPEQMMAKSGFGIEYFVCEASHSIDELTGKGKVSFKKQDGVMINVRNDGACYLHGRKYAGDLVYTADEFLRMDTLPNMVPIIKGVQNQVKAMKLA